VRPFLAAHCRIAWTSMHVFLLPIIKLLIIFVVIIVDYYLLVVKVLDNAVSAARICKIEDNNQ